MLEIIVPATSANIGPGFDCLGIALNLYNKFYIEEIENSVQIVGCEDAFSNKDNLVYKSMKYFFDNVECNYIPKGVKIYIKSDIPISRGLGSSATCIVAGVLAANHLSKSNLSKDELLKLATEIEGHPDNVAPAIFGNMIVSIMDDSKIHYNIIKIPNELKFCAIIPDFRLSTEKARSVLPVNVPHTDGIFNVGRVSLLISAIMNSKFELIKVACQDKMHQNYRGTLIKDYDNIVSYANNLNCVGVFLSGAGPTIMSIIKHEDRHFINNMSSFLNKLESSWVVQDLECDYSGAIVNILE
ncbi:homoserine kinase [Romboutsia sp.]|uniref:homoserine kinase n=1 Tax=Romboutsia sp. TaxID=1965302 RepID=UPI003F416123